MDIFGMSNKERAAKLAYIPQSHQPPFPFKVKDIVLMGRTPHMSSFGSSSHEDRKIALAALCQLSIQHLADRVFPELSGGQQQLVLIARALAQQPDVLIMDEPTASLDFGNQQLVLSRMRDLVDCGMTVIMVTHDPAHAFFCADRVIVLHNGGLLCEGTPAEAITPKTMRTIYNLDVRIVSVETSEHTTEYACVPVSHESTGDKRFLEQLVKSSL